MESLSEEWEKIRFYGPSGLFHSWEVEQTGDISWEERIISENYYASTRTFWGDALTLLKHFLPKKKAVYKTHDMNEEIFNGSKIIHQDSITEKNHSNIDMLLKENIPLESRPLPQ